MQWECFHLVTSNGEPKGVQLYKFSCLLVWKTCHYCTPLILVLFFPKHLGQQKLHIAEIYSFLEMLQSESYSAGQNKTGPKRLVLQSGFSCGENGKHCKLENRDVTGLSIHSIPGLRVWMSSWTYEWPFQTIGCLAKKCDFLVEERREVGTTVIISPHLPIILWTADLIQI